MNFSKVSLFTLFFSLIFSSNTYAKIDCNPSRGWEEKFSKIPTSPTPCEDSVMTQIFNNFKKSFPRCYIDTFDPMIAACEKGFNGSPNANTSGMKGSARVAKETLNRRIQDIQQINKTCADSIRSALEACHSVFDGLVQELSQAQCSQKDVDGFKDVITHFIDPSKVKKKFCTALKNHAKGLKAEASLLHSHGGAMSADKNLATSGGE